MRVCARVVCVCTEICVSVCVHKGERGREGERERRGGGGENDREKVFESLCACVRVFQGERQRESKTKSVCG